MAFSTSSPQSGRRRLMMPMAEINIIPLVDVVLVLLIIFMLTAHVMEFGLEVEVPKVKMVESTPRELPIVTIAKSGAMQLNELKDVNIHVLGAEIKKRFPDVDTVYVRADKGAIWDVMAQVISALGEAKLKVQVVTQPVDDNGRRQR